MRSTITLLHLAGGPVNQQELVELLGVDPSSMVAVLNDLDDHGLAERRRDAMDRRRHIVELTADGAATLTKVQAVLDGADDALLVGLSARKRDQLRSLLLEVAATDASVGEC